MVDDAQGGYYGGTSHHGQNRRRGATGARCWSSTSSTREPVTQGRRGGRQTLRAARTTIVIAKATGSPPIWARPRARATLKGIFPVSAFVYESEQDRYRCPAGHHLYYHNYRKGRAETIEYPDRGGGVMCGLCPLRGSCTRALNGRTVTRPIFSEPGVPKPARRKHEAGRRGPIGPGVNISWKAVLPTQPIITGSNGPAGGDCGGNRVQDWLCIATVQNLRILIRRGGKRAGEWLGTLRVGTPTVLRFHRRRFPCSLLPWRHSTPLHT